MRKSEAFRTNGIYSKEKVKMKNNMLVFMLLVLAVFLAALGVHADSNKQALPKKEKQPTTSVQQKDKTEPTQTATAASDVQIKQTNPPQNAPSVSPSLGYKMVTDALDGFGGESESDNYRIPVNSGGQASVVGISVGVAYGIDAGFVYASHVKRGDASANGLVDMGDAIFLLNYLFRGGADPCPMEAGDANCNGQVDMGDAIFLLNYLFKGGEAPSC
jgi:hypothetical protein